MDPSGLPRILLILGIHFEPEAPYLQGRCSTRLSYGPISMIEVWNIERLVKYLKLSSFFKKN